MTAVGTALRAALRFAARDLPPFAVRVDGTTLTLYRIAAGVTALDVAAALDVSKQRVSTMEKAGCPVELANRYRAAVDLLTPPVAP